MTVDVVPSIKHCPTCDRTLPMDDFYRETNSRDGHKYECKSCCRARVDRNRDQFIAEHGIEAWREKKRLITAAHRERTGNERGRAYARAQWRAWTALAKAHPDQYRKLLDRELYEAGLS